MCHGNHRGQEDHLFRCYRVKGEVGSGALVCHGNHRDARRTSPCCLQALSRSRLQLDGAGGGEGRGSQRRWDLPQPDHPGTPAQEGPIASLWPHFEVILKAHARSRPTRRGLDPSSPLLQFQGWPPGRARAPRVRGKWHRCP